MSHLQEKLAMAARHQSEGRLPQARRLYAEVLEEQPDCVEAMHLLGVLLLQVGQVEQALELVGRAATLSPGDAGVLNSLGLAYRHGEQLDEAEACYRRALALDGEDPAAHTNLGELLAQRGALEPAEAAFERALELDDAHTQALYNLAGLLHRRGEAERALELYREAEKQSPDDWQIRSNQGLLLRDMGRLDEAEASLRRALMIDPGNPTLSVNLASVLLDAGDAVEAEKLCLEAVTLAPDNPLAQLILGRSRLTNGNQAGAVLALVKAISLHRELPSAHAMLGDAMRMEGRVDKALECYQRALDLDPEDPAVRFAQADAQLLTGQHQLGFDGLAARRELPAVRARLPRIPRPRWQGQDLSGETVLLHADGDLSEALLLLRHLPGVQERGGRVLLACPSRLERLADSSALADQLLLPGEEPPDYAVHAALDDLPRLLGAEPTSAPAPPYLAPSELLAAQWARYLDSGDQFAVGFLWKGEGNRADPHERIPADAWRELWSLEGTRWASLQYGLTEQEARDLAAEPLVADLAARVKDLADALCAAAALDLVITADTAVAHMAGAAGLEAWVVLPAGPAWCWGLEGETTAWYPSLRLFRQRKHGEWGEVMKRVAEALRARLAERGEGGVPSG